MPMTIQHVEEEKQKKGHTEKIECKSMEKLENELEAEAESLIHLEEIQRLAQMKKARIKELKEFKKIINVEKIIDLFNTENHSDNQVNLKRPIEIKSEVPSEEPNKYEESIEGEACDDKKPSIEELIKRFDTLPHHYHMNRLNDKDKPPEVTATSNQEGEIKPCMNTSKPNKNSFFGNNNSEIKFEEVLKNQRKNLKPVIGGQTKSMLFKKPNPVSTTDDLHATLMLAIQRK